MIESFSIRLLSAIISAPLSLLLIKFSFSIFSIEIEKVFIDFSISESLFYIFTFLFTAYVFYFPAFLIIGIPISYLVDYFAGKIPIKDKITKYFIKFVLYLLLTSIILSILFDTFLLFDFETYKMIMVTALVGFHVLFLIRKEYYVDF